MCQQVAQVYDLFKHRTAQMADGKIVAFPQDERILEILDSAGMGVKGLWLVRVAFPNVTVEQVLAVLERHAVN